MLIHCTCLISSLIHTVIQTISTLNQFFLEARGTALCLKINRYTDISFRFATEAVSLSFSRRSWWNPIDLICSKHCLELGHSKDIILHKWTLSNSVEWRYNDMGSQSSTRASVCHIVSQHSRMKTIEYEDFLFVLQEFSLYLFIIFSLISFAKYILMEGNKKFTAGKDIYKRDLSKACWCNVCEMINVF